MPGHLKLTGLRGPCLAGSFDTPGRRKIMSVIIKKASASLHWLFVCRECLSRLVGIIAEALAQPAFDFGHGHAFAFGIILDLIAVDLADPEVAGFGVTEVPATD